MKLIIPKKKPDIVTIGAVALFFITAAFLFTLYAIDRTALILIAILALYLRFFHMRKSLPSFLDLVLLSALAILIVVVTTIILGRSAYSVSAIGFTILITLLFDDLHLSLLFALIIAILTASVEREAFGFGPVDFHLTRFGVQIERKQPCLSQMVFQIGIPFKA